MRKVFTLIVVLVLCMNYSKGQVLFNEVNADENNFQYIELFNSGSSNEDLDCYTLITVSSETGPVLSVLDFKSINLGAGEFLALNNNNWGSTYSTIHRYTANGNIYTETTLSTATNLMITGQKRNAAFLFKRGVLVDVLVMKESLGNAQTWIAGIPDLQLNYEPCSGVTLSIDFNTISSQISIKNVVPSAGNGCYARVSDGPCYGWTKRSGKGDETPGATNGTPRSDESNLIYTAPYWQITNLTYADFQNNQISLLLPNNTIPEGSLAYNDLASPPTATVNITLGEFSVNARDLNVNIRVWEDLNGDDIIDYTSDRLYNVVSLYVNSTSASVGPTPITIPVSKSQILIEVVSTPGTCFFSTKEDLFTKAANLPVLLNNYKVSSSRNTNKISWSTSTEQNNKGFEIQRSIGNTNDFKTIGFVGTRAKNGNSQTEISYSFEDADIKAGQTHYYRLNQIDFDGKSAFSPVKSIKPGSIESNLNIYPNPSQGTFTVNTGSNSGKLNIFLMDNTGRVVNQFMNVSTSNTRINNLKKGFYTLKIVNTESGEQSAQRVVVQ